MARKSERFVRLIRSCADERRPCFLRPWSTTSRTARGEARRRASRSSRASSACRAGACAVPGPHSPHMRYRTICEPARRRSRRSFSRKRIAPLRPSRRSAASRAHVRCIDSFAAFWQELRTKSAATDRVLSSTPHCAAASNRSRKIRSSRTSGKRAAARPSNHEMGFGTWLKRGLAGVLLRGAQEYLPIEPARAAITHAARFSSIE